jgi:hypothetical protein
VVLEDHEQWCEITIVLSMQFGQLLIVDPLLHIHMLYHPAAE